MVISAVVCTCSYGVLSSSRRRPLKETKSVFRLRSPNLDLNISFTYNIHQKIRNNYNNNNKIITKEQIIITHKKCTNSSGYSFWIIIPWPVIYTYHENDCTRPISRAHLKEDSYFSAHLLLRIQRSIVSRPSLSHDSWNYKSINKIQIFTTDLFKIKLQRKKP